MKRDPTIWPSLLLIAVPSCILAAMRSPRGSDEQDQVLFIVLFLLVLIGAIRAVVLWFQPLIHGVQYAKEENRVAVVLAHVVLGVPMGYLYYWSARIDAERSADERSGSAED